jgi:hypothetical protein
LSEVKKLVSMLVNTCKLTFLTGVTRGRGARPAAADVIQRQALDSSGQAVSKEGHQQTLDRLQCGNLLLQGGDLRCVLRSYGLNAFRGMAL